MEKFKKFLKENEKKYASAFKQHGLAGLKSAIVQELDMWKSETINIAVIGQSGTGKSSLINAILGLPADHPEAAKVSSIQATTSVTAYKHPKNRNFMIWDFPGVGAESMPRETYLQEMVKTKFDFFIIVSSKRFTQIDIWLAKEIEKMKTFFYFVRAQVHDDFENEMCKRRKKKIPREVQEEVTSKIRAECEENLEEFKFKKNIFLVDSYETNQYDFNELQERTIRDASAISYRKQDAIILTLSSMTKSAIEEKRVILEKRIWNVALCAAFAPRFNDADIRILEGEKQFYISQFKLDAESLEKLTKMSDIRVQLSEMEKELNANRQAQTEVLMLEFDQLMPFLPPFTNIRTTYKIGKAWLKLTLDMTFEFAIQFNASLLKRTCEILSAE